MSLASLSFGMFASYIELIWNSENHRLVPFEVYNRSRIKHNWWLLFHFFLVIFNSLSVPVLPGRLVVFVWLISMRAKKTMVAIIHNATWIVGMLDNPQVMLVFFATFLQCPDCRRPHTFLWHTFLQLLFLEAE